MGGTIARPLDIGEPTVSHEPNPRRSFSAMGERREPAYQNFCADLFTEIKVLHHGGASTTRLIYDNVFGFVVVKEFRPHQQHNAVQVAQVRDMLGSMRFSHHPNIISYYGPYFDNTRQDNLLGYVMEYMEGGNLQQQINTPEWKNRALDVEKLKLVLSWARQAAQALAYCHDHDILFRNVRPDKMLLNSSGTVLKIGDFKHIRENDGREGTANVLMEGYRAPECFDSHPVYTEACDVYSLSISIWEMFCGRWMPSRNVLLFRRDIEQGKRPPLERILDSETEPDVKTLVREGLFPVLESGWNGDSEKRPNMCTIIAHIRQLENLLQNKN